MSEIECAQLHSELFRRRHSIRQWHGLFALAKHLLISDIRSLWLALSPESQNVRMSEIKVVRLDLDSTEYFKMLPSDTTTL